MRRRLRNRGWAALMMLMVVSSIAIVATVGLRARTTDLSLEDRSLCRAQARWAAESGIARARSQLKLGYLPPPSMYGQLTGVQSDVRYKLTIVRSGGTITIAAEGTCTRAELTSRSKIDVLLSGGGRTWRIAKWDEPVIPPPPPEPAEIE